MSYVEFDKILSHTYRLDGWKRGDKPAPITVEWDLSNRCSLGCAGCHFGYTHTRGPLAGKRDKPQAGVSGGDLADPELVCRGLGEMVEAGVRAVVWSGGGEPTLHPQFVDVVTYAMKVGLKQGIYTHGGHVDEVLAFAIGRSHEWAVISLDCVDAESYATYKQVPPLWFDRACNGIRRLAEQKSVIVGVSFLLDANNWRRADDMLALSRSLGANYTTLRPMVHYSMDNPAVSSQPTDWIDDAMPILERLSHESDVECKPDRFLEYRHWKREYSVCYGIRFNTTITPDGRMWVCPNRREFADSCIGDLNNESFMDVWARHPGQWTDFSKCRVFCRLHMINKTVAPVYAEYQHPEFI